MRPARNLGAIPKFCLRAPHEHRWDLAESEELVTFWILRVFDGKRIGFF